MGQLKPLSTMLLNPQPSPCCTTSTLPPHRAVMLTANSWRERLLSVAGRTGKIHLVNPSNCKWCIIRSPLACNFEGKPQSIQKTGYLKWAGWWFGTFFIFPYIGNNHPIWLKFFRGVETTNQMSVFHVPLKLVCNFTAIYSGSVWTMEWLDRSNWVHDGPLVPSGPHFDSFFAIRSTTSYWRMKTNLQEWPSSYADFIFPQVFPKAIHWILRQRRKPPNLASLGRIWPPAAIQVPKMLILTLTSWSGPRKYDFLRFRC